MTAFHGHSGNVTALAFSEVCSTPTLRLAFWGAQLGSQLGYEEAQRENETPAN